MTRFNPLVPLHANAANGRLRALAAIGLILLGVAEVASVVAEIVSDSATIAATRARDILQTQDDLFIALEGAERGQRGYLLTQDASYVRPYQDSTVEIPPLMGHLRALVRNDPRQAAAVATLTVMVGEKMGELARTVSLERAGQHDQAVALVRSNHGRNTMSQLQQVIGQSRAIERARLNRRRAFVHRMRGALRVVTTLGLALAALLAYVITRAWSEYETILTERNDALAAEMLEREKAESRLRQAQKMDALGQLTGGVAHDFNNMLAIIVGSLDMLLRKLAPDQVRLKSLTEIALGGANRAASLTRRLLAFSRLQPLDPRPTDINRCVGELSEVFRRTLGENIFIETVLAGGLWLAHIDLPQLESALLNLAVNARDAMPGGGKLTIETNNTALDQAYAAENEDVVAGQYVLVAVTDTGIGMSQDIAARAFDPFFTTKKVGHGTGLGLSQVHGFMRQSGGHAKIYSEPGVGTTVKLYLPRDTAGRAAEPVAAPPSATRAGTPLTVLVVEDEPGVREMTVGALTELGYAVRAADGAAAALEILDTEPEIAIMLTDVVMPDTNGRQLAERALQQRPDLRILYMTGYTRNAIVHNGVLDPGTRLLSKPFTITQLDHELSRIVAELPPG